LKFAWGGVTMFTLPFSPSPPLCASMVQALISTVSVATRICVLCTKQHLLLLFTIIFKRYSLQQDLPKKFQLDNSNLLFL
jgi:hypothetical protein